MATLRDFLGTRCPTCRKDILQQAPSTNRMPGADLAYCPSCQATLTLDDLTRKAGRFGFLARLRGRPQRG